MEWISVNDRLPEKQLDYLVTDGDTCMVAFFRMKNKEWDFFKNDFWDGDFVTHWMPLPELPKED